MIIKEAADSASIGKRGAARLPAAGGVDSNKKKDIVKERKVFQTDHTEEEKRED